MKKLLPNGTEVLIFNYIEEWGYDQNETSYIRGVIQKSSPSYDLSYHGSSWDKQIYEVLGDDGKTYYGTYGFGLIGDSFFRTIDDHIEYIENLIKSNSKKIAEINNRNKLLLEELCVLRDMDHDFSNNQLVLKKTK